MPTRRAHPDLAQRRRWLTLPVLCLSLIIIGLDNTILNVALPTLAKPTSGGGLDASASELSWIVDAYTIVFAGLLLTVGSLSDRLSRYRALTVGLVVFGLASVLAACASSAVVLILGRALMGVGAAAVMPATLSILPNVFRDPKERALAIGIWSGASAIGVGLGPVVGGLLLKKFWWGSVFLVNLPIIAIALVAGYYLVPDSRDADAKRLDPLGSILSIAAVSVLLWAVIEGPTYGWSSASVLVAFALGAVVLGCFLAWEWRCTHPMLDLRVFRNSRFSAASGAVAVGFFALFGTVFLLTQYLQQVLGYSAVEAGGALLPQSLVLMVLAPLSPRWVRRFGNKAVVAAGLAVLSTSLVLMTTFRTDSSAWWVVLVTCITSAGMANVTAPATDAIMGSLSRSKAGVGSAVNNVTRQMGGALGVALLGSILVSGYRPHVDDALRGQVPGPLVDRVDDSIGGALGVARDDSGARAYAARIVDAARGGFVDGMHSAVILGAVIAALGVLIVVVWMPARARTEPGGPQTQATTVPSGDVGLRTSPVAD